MTNLVSVDQISIMWRVVLDRHLIDADTRVFVPPRHNNLILLSKMYLIFLYKTFKVINFALVLECEPVYKLCVIYTTADIVLLRQRQHGYHFADDNFKLILFMMTSSNGNTFRATGRMCGNSPVTGDFPSQRPVTRSFDVLFDLRLNKQLSKQSRRRWFKTPSFSLWRHCHVWKFLFIYWNFNEICLLSSINSKSALVQIMFIYRLGNNAIMYWKIHMYMRPSALVG